MILLFSRVISKLKNENFQIDANIPSSYVCSVLIDKFLCLIWGMMTFRTCHRIFRHPTSTVKCISKFSYGTNLNIGRRCYINALSKEGLICGNNVSMGHYTHIELTGSLRNLGRGLKIGNNVGLGTHGFYGSGVGGAEIGNDVIFGNYVSVHPENHNYKNLDIPIRLQGVNGQGIKIGNNCWIGAKVTILDGTIIGDNCIVAAGAVVKGEFPANSIIGGVPAKILKMRI